MAKLSLASAAVYVRDRAEAARWYAEKLGARIVTQDPEHWTTVRLGGRHALEIHLCENDEGPATPEDAFGDTGFLLLAEGDLRAAHRELAGRGVRFVHPPEKAPWGWFAKFVDLDGNQFWLMSRPK